MPGGIGISRRVSQLLDGKTSENEFICFRADSKAGFSWSLGKHELLVNGYNVTKA